MSSSLNPDKALIFRIVHRDNLPWILDNGLHCRSSAMTNPNYVNIGSPELIDRRATRAVEISPYGTLADYIPVLLHAVFANDAQHQDRVQRRGSARQRGDRDHGLFTAQAA